MTSTEPQVDHDSDRDLHELDDEADREELRSRYYGLLQELRVVLPGVEVLVAFLLTVAFSNRFEDLDSFGRLLFGIALMSATASVVCLLTPTVLHRAGERRARQDRLRWGIRLTVAGVAWMGLAIVSVLWSVLRLVYAARVAGVLTLSMTVILVGLWVVLPRSLDRAHDRAH